MCLLFSGIIFIIPLQFTQTSGAERLPRFEGISTKVLGHCPRMAECTWFTNVLPILLAMGNACQCYDVSCMGYLCLDESWILSHFLLPLSTWIPALFSTVQYMSNFHSFLVMEEICLWVNFHCIYQFDASFFIIIVFAF